MKIHYIVAASLFVGTSALAWGPSTAPVADSDKEMVQPAAYKVDSKDWKGDTKAPQAALVAKSNDLPAVETPMAQSAAMSEFDAKAMTSPETLDKADAQAMADADMDLAMTDQEMTLAEAKPMADEAPAMGGPVELADNSAALAPRPAAGNYPACAPGPGDDNCIQLYEPGVQVALASWNQPTGGLMDETRTAMGGPFEPVDGKAVESGADEELLAAADLPAKEAADSSETTTASVDTKPVKAEPALKA